jgi:DNA adenine methylase
MLELSDLDDEPLPLDWNIPGLPATLKPWFRWVGGKGRIVGQILQAIPEEIKGRYIDPTLGSGAVPLRILQEKRALASQMVLSDLNPHLIACWKAVQKNPDELLKRTQILQDRPFKDVKESAPSNEMDQAARFLFLQAKSFNGLWRENREGTYNVSQDPSKKGPVGNEQAIKQASRAIKGAKILVADMFAAIEGAGQDDVIYCDPPYHGTFKGYVPGGFTAELEAQLAERLTAAVGRGALVLTSNSDDPVVRGLYEGWDIREITSRRSISCDGEGRGEVQELLLVKRPRRVDRYRENRCPHGFVDLGVGLCPDCDPASTIRTMGVPGRGTKARMVLEALATLVPGVATTAVGLSILTGLGGQEIEHVLRRMVQGDVVIRGGNTVALTASGMALVVEMKA